MTQELFNVWQQKIRDDLCNIIRKEIEKEKEETQTKNITKNITRALWSVHKLKATIHIDSGCKGVQIFDLVPGLTARTNKRNAWVGLCMSQEVPDSLHGDLTWHVTVTRKDGTSEKILNSGKFNYGRFFIEKILNSGKFNYGRFFIRTDEGTDERADSWGNMFKTEIWENITNIIIEVNFKRNNEEKLNIWKTMEEQE